MDDIFDNLIYIVIAIVAFAISALGKKKKRDESRIPLLSDENQEQEKAKPFFANFEQLLNEEIGFPNPNIQNQYIPEPTVDEQPEAKEVLDSVPPDMLDDKEGVPYSIEYDDTSEIFLNAIKDAEITDVEEEPIIEDFNIRDAVIYSEILNKKEY